MPGESSNASVVLGDCSNSLKPKQVNDAEEQVVFDYQQKDMLDALKATMMQEAMRISRASELFYKKKL